MKKVLSLLLAMAMVISLVPSVFAAEDVGGTPDVGLWVDEFNLDDMTIVLDAGNENGITYSWTAAEDGNVTFAGYVPVEGEDEVAPEFDIIVSSGDTVVSKFEETGASVDVVAGDMVLVQYVAVPDAEGNYPAMTISAWGTFTPPAGTENNPIVPEYVWNDDYTEATAVVIAPAGTTTYFAIKNGGMMLSIDGAEGYIVQASMWTGPHIISFTNDGEEDAEHTLKLWTPVGTMDNPEALTLGWNEVSLPADSYEGYYYTWTAEDTGVFTAYIGSITEGVEADIVINNKTTYVNRTLLADGVDNNGLEVSMDVNKGDEIAIQIAVMPDAEWKYPAADITWISSFAYPAGSEANPITVEFEMNETYTVGTATIIAPVGTTYYQAYGIGGMMMSINGAEPVAMVGNPRMPVIFTIVNDGEAEAGYVLTVTYPLGSRNNPAALAIGDNTANIEAGSQGYMFNWTAAADGTLTVTMPEGNWTYVINNLTTGVYGDTQWSDAAPVNPAVVEVTAGDKIQLIVNTYDPENPHAAPAGTLVINAAFAEPEPEQPEFEITGQPTDTNSGINERGVFTVEVNLEGATYQWYVDKQDGNGFIPATYTGNNTNTLSIAYYDSRVGWQAFCKVTAPDGTVIDTEIATWTIREANLTITGGSSGNRAVVLNTTATFVINVEGDDVIYQWQVDVNDGKGFVNVTPTSYKGYNEKRLYITAFPKTEGYKVRCVVMDSTGGRTYGPVATLTIKDNPLVVTEHPASQEVVLDSTVTFKAACSGNVGDVSYIWMISGDGGATWSKTGFKGFNTDTLTVSAYNSRNGKMFKCVMQDSEKNKIESNPAVLTLSANPLVMETNAKSIAVDANTQANFTFIVGGEPVGEVSYQWYYRKTSEGTWSATSATGAKTSTLTVDAWPSRNGYQYYCRAVDEAGNVLKSRVVTLTVNS